MEIKNTAIIGIGAVGGVYAKYLHKTYGKAFNVVAGKERKTRIEKDGVKVNGEVYYPNVIDPENKSIEKMDLIIFGVKNYDLDQAIEDVRYLVKEGTIMLPLLNGVTASERIKSAYPEARVFLGLSMGIDALRGSDGIVNTDNGIVQLGYEDNSVIADEVSSVEYYLKSAGIDARVYKDMKRMLWRKWMLNVGVNQASAITGAEFKYFNMSKELLELFRSAMLEVLKLAEAEGVDLTIKDLEDIQEVILNFTPEGKTSMLQDTEAKRRTEIDYFAKTVVEYGKRLNVPTPVNEVLYLAIKAKEQIYLADKNS